MAGRYRVENAEEDLLVHPVARLARLTFDTAAPMPWKQRWMFMALPSRAGRAGAVVSAPPGRPVAASTLRHRGDDDVGDGGRNQPRRRARPTSRSQAQGSDGRTVLELPRAAARNWELPLRTRTNGRRDPGRNGASTTTSTLLRPSLLGIGEQRVEEEVVGNQQRELVEAGTSGSESVIILGRRCRDGRPAAAR